ncbi:hypothetical protein [Oenococcus oeni]|uniref:Prephenate dehydratase n=1 Tax=Oenococcus oeni (strain ATCC BAA-331 / PSU-1) TaxID=203123 RepID=Q04HC8_OENOB|nr:hypothetical protein [Oenococcus oeni]ABJ56144.1 hypothetical protein OEOE_0151 [Oenococcus oeni PSU-1]EKP90556.1 hypothetical protein AWRIB129_188 [Oenococcus oeni DSM 20252 = AWRIB129]KGH56127.1 hypothetical protein X463_03420 [Oenococcus oeni S22]KGH69021.1 hypothetical protein X466_08970 [Oenococcus oeni S25]KGH79415.1 hypothetical protein X281_09680 [Oenococcus oeni IOEB_0607]
MERLIKIHTLGPKETDSCSAAYYFSQQRTGDGDISIILHDSFETIFRHLAEYCDDLLLLPVAFKSKKIHSDWADIHYRFLTELKLIDGFIYPLSDLALIENQEYSVNQTFIHPATESLLNAYLNEKKQTTIVRFSSSKYSAYRDYRLKNARYVITNLKNVQFRKTEVIQKKYQVNMLWSVYKIQAKELIK